ncbi:MAG: amidase [Pseudomonadota bacterium]
MSPPSAADLRARLSSGALSARTLADACLETFAARDGDIHAFVHLDPEHVRRQADALDAHRKAGRPLGPMHGIPVALKDIVDTADYPTENGTPLDAGRKPKRDATLVARLRAAGALIIGKTVTTEFAFREPGATRNPHRLSHTPGGSSQGSAAAVAAGMVPVSIGSQTIGSTIRPASFCGVVGLKPSHGAVSLTGVLSTAVPLDTAGIFATTVEDAALTLGVVAGFDPGDERTRPMPQADYLAAARAQPPLPPAFAVMEGPFWADASDTMKGLIAEISEALGGLDRPALPDLFDNAHAAHMTIMKVGFARNLRHYKVRGEAAISDAMREAMAEGEAISATDYLAALDWQNVLRDGIDRVFERYDALITPAAPGEAPEGLESTGDSRFNALATFLGAPCVSIPVGLGETGLPLGIQVVGRPGEDAKLIRTAAWLSSRLGADE